MKIKKIDWNQNVRNGSYLGYGIGALYAIDVDHDGVILAKHVGASTMKSFHVSLDAAKEYAQDHNDARIKEWLEAIE